MRKFSFIFALLLLFIPAISFAQSVDLLWQGDGYTPPFYKGKTLWARQTRITFLAIPEGVGNTSNLYYRWLKNGTVLGSLSGIGKNSYVHTDSILSRKQTIRVEILAQEGYEEPIIAARSITLEPTETGLAVYENNPLYGFMFHKEASGTHPLKGEEVTFAAFPLFFGVSSRVDPSLTYEWRTNTGEAGAKNSVTYRAPEEGSGTSAIYINLANSVRVFQTANNSFLVKFGENE